MAERTRFLLTYHCPDCDETWEDTWSCIVDDECPSCGVTYTAAEVDDL
jgi:uncharacterized protein (DUF983 family)